MKKQNNSIFDFVKVIVMAILLAMVFRTFVFQPFFIPSESMVPNLLVGDRLFVNKFAYGYSKHSIPFAPNIFEGRFFYTEPERGDVAVFRFPFNRQSQDWVKRVIALPGDRVQMRRGKLYINGNIVPRDLVETREFEDYYGNIYEISEYNETLPNGVEHLIFEISDDKDLDNTPVYTVPKDMFFLMGDNRDNSDDSRRGWFIHKDYLIGEALIIFFSYDNKKGQFWEFWKWHNAIRFDRILNIIK